MKVCIITQWEYSNVDMIVDVVMENDFERFIELKKENMLASYRRSVEENNNFVKYKEEPEFFLQENGDKKSGSIIVRSSQFVHSPDGIVLQRAKKYFSYEWYDSWREELPPTDPKAPSA